MSEDLLWRIIVIAGIVIVALGIIFYVITNLVQTILLSIVSGVLTVGLIFFMRDKTPSNIYSLIVANIPRVVLFGVIIGNVVGPFLIGLLRPSPPLSPLEQLLESLDEIKKKL